MKPILMIAILLSTALIAHAEGGKEVGNGGLGFVCRNANGEVESALLADFYESENDPSIGYHVNQTSTPWKDQFIGAIEQTLYSTALQIDAKYYYKEMMASIRLLNRGVGLVLPGGDENHIMISHPRCPLEVIALHKGGIIAINQDIFDKLSETDKAGLYLHELLYWVGRKNNFLTTSDPVRPLVAAAFSPDKISRQPNTRFAYWVSQLVSYFGQGYPPYHLGNACSSWINYSENPAPPPVDDSGFLHWAIWRESEKTKTSIQVTTPDGHFNTDFGGTTSFPSTYIPAIPLDSYYIKELSDIEHPHTICGFDFYFSRKSKKAAEFEIDIWTTTKGREYNTEEDYNSGTITFPAGTYRKLLVVQPRIIYGDNWKK